LFQELAPDLPLSDPDEAFRSARDNEPFVIYFQKAGIAEDQRSIIAHESTGSEGVRFVLTRWGEIEPLTEANFQRELLLRGPRSLQRVQP
jgi:hypothetical protein